MVPALTSPNGRCRWSMLLLLVATGIAVPVAAQAQARQASLVIGVVDSATGRPLEDVLVVDLRTRISVRTTKDGTAVLSHVDSSGVLVSLQRIGYRPLTRQLSLAGHDSSLTIALAPLPQPVPRVVTEGRMGDRHRGAADTLRTLELNGFYERRLRTAAPSSAFVTEEKLSRLTTLANLSYLTGRGICTQNLYVDGVRFRFDRSFYGWLRPEMVAGIELYTHAAEIPSLYNVTLPSGSASHCATLVWTKR
jgi:hypothetical protein